MESFFPNLTQTVLSFIDSAGHIGLVVIIALESILPLVPSEVILPLTGFLVSRGDLTFTWAFIASTLGSVLGAFCLYYICSKIGEKRVLQIVKRYGWFLGVSVHDVERSFELFLKYGPPFIFFGRIIPGIRSVISIPAGLSHMRKRTFILYTALGSSVWNILLISVGVILGKRWREVFHYTKFMEHLVWIALLVIVALILLRKFQRKSKQNKAA